MSPFWSENAISNRLFENPCPVGAIGGVMCGIVGVCDYSGSVERAHLARATETIVHRGPDDGGIEFWQGGRATVGLGSRRLSIIDLSLSGHQPMCNEDGSIWIVFNGEIYNFSDLRAQLLKRGHEFKSNTDTETIIHLYEECGEHTPERLSGMFAFTIWDRNKQILFSARDRFGIKPYYYYHDPTHFLFASEIKSIKAIPGLDLAIDRASIDSYFTYGYIPGEASAYRRIRKLLPGRTLTFDVAANRLRTRQYWCVTYDPTPQLSEVQWCTELEATLSQAVESHMVSDVPIGAFLSGGIDSSTVVALMSRCSSQPVKTFSIGFVEPEFNEMDVARSVAKAFETDHHEMIVEPESISLLSKLVQAYDEPFADSSAIPTYYVSRFAREHVKVVLSGDGGDELFAGYTNYSRQLKLDRYNFRSDVLKKLVWGSLYRAYPTRMRGKELLYLMSKRGSGRGAYQGAWPMPDRLRLYQSDFREEVRRRPAEERLDRFLDIAGNDDPINRQLEVTTRTSLVDDNLLKIDRVSMQHGLEVRVPLLDHKVAELTFRMPSHLKLHNGIGKYILRKTMAPHLPDVVLNHPKQGFVVPLKYWFKDSLYEFLHDRFATPHNKASEFISPDRVRELLGHHKHGTRNISNKLWRILFFEEWIKQNA